MARVSAGRRVVDLVLAASVLVGCSQTVPVTTNSVGGAVQSAAGFPASSVPLALEGSPAAVVIAGTPYTFKPTVSPSDAAVSFAIANAPRWATFDSTTGALGGTPASSDVGTTANIVITATRGAESAALGPFVITVAQPAPSPPVTPGSAVLTWVAPTTNTDGSPLSALAGYRIYYGTSATMFSQKVTIVGTASTTYTVNGLAGGVYYFAVTAYSASGNESALSNVVSKGI